ncbi:phage-related baseplate assembly protein [Sedimentibacter acidaminivorans]|uniref:Phage-related baseplate assembly protein n=1 Tax=Sedimentibacter acidaminivorans TaxID=913099 RepID=A0ABS4GGL9_9FIRM|nr:baseplate J/gp47 family protein [Sedimentibacter acidaminivorans]MBP1926839.1 phage-related baseplate assembly protein [Sedimentibacter acidaminivorans]
MNDFNFLDIDSKQIYEDLIKDFEKAYGEILYAGDERRIFLSQMVPALVALKSNINQTGKQNLLSYAVDESLDNLGNDLYSTERLQPTKAIAKGLITLTGEQVRIITVPAGKRVTPDGQLFFIVKDEVSILPGETSKECVLEAMETGTKYNNFLAGRIMHIVDTVPFVASIVNTETTYNGGEIEENARYRLRCRLSNKSKSTTGPDDAYKYFAMTADSSISDVDVSSPSPGVVEMVVLLENGELPSDEILNKVLEQTSRRDRRPLTDKVLATKPNIINYDINIKYYIDETYLADELSIRKVIEGNNMDYIDGAVRNYVNWQHEKLGRSINPDMLLFYIQNSYMIDGKTPICRVEINSPTYTEINSKSVAKALNISVEYGGLL